jgi:hypothetical protein
VSETLAVPSVGAQERDARIRLWKQQEWHGWFRWWLCGRGVDWSKPIWIALLLLGFGSLAFYGYVTSRWFVTAGGVVAWFTLVNLSFFTYFGLSLPGPPRAIPGPFPPGRRVKATMALYPAGYERRKLPRVLLRIPQEKGDAAVIELAVPNLDAELAELLAKQSMTRMQRGDAPATDAIVETVAVSREQIDAGELPLRVLAWRWDETSTRTFSATASSNSKLSTQN